jgi:hypothetical protein
MNENYFTQFESWRNLSEEIPRIANNTTTASRLVVPKNKNAVVATTFRFSKALGMACCMLLSLFAQGQVTVNFNPTGAVQPWTVPAGVTSITIETWGAQGENSTTDGTAAGNGGYATGQLSVTPCETLNIFVGQTGAIGVGGFNGGGDGAPDGSRGAGGGASDVRKDGADFIHRVIVAGGGGGAGTALRIGGDGGDTNGVDGFDNGTNDGPGGAFCDSGDGGTQSGGGASIDALPGTFGEGGDPIPGGMLCSGGGGGWYGGGSGNGAGGGSGYIGGVINASMQTGLQTGDGLVQVTYFESTEPIDNLACNANINVSVDANCMVSLMADMILGTGNYLCNDQYLVNVIGLTPASAIIGNGTSEVLINASELDGFFENGISDEFEVMVIDVNDNNNSCWNEGWTIEDKLGPNIECEDYEITCLDSIAPSELTTPIVTDNCEIGIIPTYVDSIGDTDCGGAFFQYIVRTWTATDLKGNTSTCSQTISISRPAINVTTVICPPQYDGMPGNEPVLSCSGTFEKDANGHPAPSETGEPTINGQSLNSICMYDSEYVDTDSIEICEGGYAIYREWTIYDWCNSPDTYTCNQVIKVMDTEGPTITCLDSITANAYANCVANFIVPTPTIIDVCSPNGIYYLVTASAGTVVPFGIAGHIVNGLPIGTHTITYTAYDGCDNPSTCSFEVTVEDHQAPVLPCQTNTTVGLSNDGSEVHWNTFLNLSNVTDNCGVEEIVVRRMDMSHCAVDDSSPFAETVPFFCCDIGNTVTIEVRATDIYDNVNTCTIFATVMDNVAPIFSPCPSALDTAYCDDLTRLDIYEDVTADADGTVDVPAPGPLTYVINLDDPANPDTVFYGYYNNNIWDNCDTEVYIWTTGSINDCGNSVDANGDLLPLQRYYVAVDQSGNVSAPCIQEIRVLNPDLFDPATDITSWPADYTSPGAACGTSILPDDLPVGSQRPVVVSTLGCDNTAMGYEDTNPLYPVNGTESYCYKILRTWYVFDWCGMNHDTATQVIMVVDPGPDFDTACPGTQTLTDGDNLTLDVSATNLCSNTAADISYVIDLNSAGITLITGTTGSINEAVGGTNFPVVGVGEQPHTITFTAEGCTTNSTCEVIINVLPMAPPSATSNVSGAISNESNSMVENVTVTPASGMDVYVTDINGAYNMNLATSENYNVTPEKNDDYLNGVSTYDIVLLSKHILQLELLDSPYKMIAADVNKSGGITTLDMVELRKLILFINEEFANNSSWRFVDANYAFPDASNPFGEIFPENYSINGLTGDMADLDFVAVKIGDVNGTATTNGFSGDSEGRDFNGTLELEMNDVQLKAGQTKTIEVKANDFNRLLGYQFTMAFEGLEVVDVAAGELTSLTTANFGMQRLQEGLLTTSWNNNEAVSLADGTVLFTVTVKATADVQLSDVLHGSFHYTAAEAYADKAGAVELMDVQFVFRDNNGVTVANGFELYQNRPNPFKDETVIGFDLPTAGDAQINVYDISGRVLLNLSGTYAKGYNEVSINRSDLPGAGVLYYELATEGNSAVRKMTIIE